MIEKNKLENNTVEYNISVNDYIEVAFRRIPSNAIVNKGRCGIGGTTLELKDERNSIIVVPNISIIENKISSFSKLIGVFGDVSLTKIEEDLRSRMNDGDFIKIMTTPESLYKIIEAAENIGLEIYRDFFLLIDESHTIITEGGYREGVRKPLEYFFKFKEKSLISATPLNFSDDRFKTLTTHIIKFNDSVKPIINLITTTSIISFLKVLIQDLRKRESNSHIFFNSVTGISKLLKLVGDEDISVFCASTSKNKNTLSDKYSHVIKEINEGYSRINFYTCKYYEGWDLYDETNPLIYLVSDVNLTNTCFDISTKGIQAFGRLRSKGDGIGWSHISNTMNIPASTLSARDVRSQKFSSATNLINLYTEINNNDLLPNKTKQTVLENLSKLLVSFSSKDKDGVFTVDGIKIDTSAYFTSLINQYANEDTLVNAWEEAEFKVNHKKYNVFLSASDSKLLNSSRVSKTNKSKLVFERLRGYKDNPVKSSFVNEKGELIFNLSNQFEYQNFINDYKDEFKYFNKLGYEKISELKFDLKSIKKQYLIEMQLELDHPDVVYSYLDTCLNVGKIYPNIRIKEVLNEMYSKVESLSNRVTAQNIHKFYFASEYTKWVNGKPTKVIFIEGKKYNF